MWGFTSAARRGTVRAVYLGKTHHPFGASSRINGEVGQAMFKPFFFYPQLNFTEG